LDFHGFSTEAIGAARFMGISGLYIREYRPADSDILAALFFRTIRTVNLGDYSQEQVEAWAPADRDLTAWAERFRGRHTFVAEMDGVIAGFAELDPSGYLDRFYVSADFVGRGVGKELYRELERRALCLRLPKIHLAASITAKPFFERRGFRVLKEQTVRPNGVAMNNFAMEKELPILEPVRRKSARALLLTPENEILLMKIVNPTGGWEGWITPGGGIEAGESEEQALRRELYEELGFHCDGGERKVWTRAHEFPWGDKILRQEEAIFLVRCRKFTPKPLDALLATEMLDVELRWWPVAEMGKSGEQFAPRRLGYFLARLEEGLPAEPIDVGI
jgi:putative acetyltransferase